MNTISLVTLSRMGKLLFNLMILRLLAYDKANEINYDCIFLDLNMPIMDGFEACKRIKIDI